MADFLQQNLTMQHPYIHIIGVLLFFVLGLMAGRAAAVLAAVIQDDSGQIKTPLWPFFLKCQRAWGAAPVLYIFKKFKKQPCPPPLAGREGRNIPFRPLVMELALGGLFAGLFYTFGWKYILLEYFIFAFGLITASAVDFERMILPDFLTLSGIVLGLGGALLNPEAGREFWPAFAGVLMGGGFLWMMAVCYYALRKEDGIGGGDIKLLAWIGAVLTWKAVPVIILLACAAGLFSSLGACFKSAESWLKTGIPFGPCLSFSALVYIFFGERLAEWYLSFFIPSHFMDLF